MASPAGTGAQRGQETGLRSQTSRGTEEPTEYLRGLTENQCNPVLGRRACENTEEDSSNPVSTDGHRSLKMQNSSSRPRIPQIPLANQLGVGLLLANSEGMGAPLVS